MSEEPTVIAPLVGGSVIFAMSLGVSPAEIWGALEMQPSDLADPDRRIPYEQATRVHRLLMSRFPERPIGLELGRAIPDERFGPAVYMARNAATLRGAVDVIQRYQHLTSSHVEITFDGGELVLRHALLEHVPSVIETGITFMVRTLRALSGGEPVLERVDFGHATRAPREAYEAFYGCPVRFEAPATRLVFAPGVLERRVAHANPTIYAVIERHVEATYQALRLRSGEGAGASPSARVRDEVVRLSRDGEYRAEVVAEALGTTLRSLQRAMKDEGTTLREVIEEARRAHAERLLRDASLSIDDVAFLVGYAEERSFNRAFKRWTGQTPAQYRRA